MRLLIDVGSCFMMLGGWFECLLMYSGSSLGFPLGSSLGYETPLDTYKKLMHDNITKAYKHGSEGTISQIDDELKHISNNLGIGDRIEQMKKREAFISLKDHKENFENNLKCRLINPAKSESGKLSKIILDKINSNLRKILNLNQWKNTQNVIEWFGNIKEKHRHSFIPFDIVDFYPSISENLLDQALSWASNLAIITKDEISIIKHARKSVLFNDGKPWTKKDSNSLFDVTMGSYDGAEICELVGLFILNKLGQKFGESLMTIRCTLIDIQTTHQAS